MHWILSLTENLIEYLAQLKKKHTPFLSLDYYMTLKFSPLCILAKCIG